MMSLSDHNPLDIAIIGYAGRFPGARNMQEFWRNLCAGMESVSTLSDEELAAHGVREELIQNPNYVKAEAQLSGYDRFDASFFGYGAREAILMDPQQRIFLECCWEALEDAGYDSERLDRLVGVFAGAGPSNYSFEYLYPHREQLGGAGGFEVGVGNALSSLTGRVSHKLDLKGPSIAVQTACSTSLVAVHLAVQSLLSEECDVTLAGAVFLKFPAYAGYVYTVDGILSPDGHCRAFDYRAQGTIFGSGVGVVVLKRLRDALADGDEIRAIIKGTAVNNDGASKAGFTAPNLQAQAEVITEALATASVDPGSITYIEAHGTGTALGDPVEIAALKKAFGAGSGRSSCAIGSVKSNIGHLDAAAGMAGLLKSVLALEHRTLPPSVNFERPNPNIDFDDGPFFVNTRLREWDSNGAPRRAGVSSFGLGGTNSHVILEEAPVSPCQDEARVWSLVPLSARNPAALETSATQLALFLDENCRPHLLADVAYTYQVGRRQWESRGFVLSRNAEEASRLLRTLQIDPAVQKSAGGKLAFILPRFADCSELANVLYREEPVFREHVADCVNSWETRFQIKCPVDFSASERASGGEPAENNGTIALFFFQYAIAKTLIGWGIVPKVMIGYGVGEIVADCLRELVAVPDALARLVSGEHAREPAARGTSGAAAGTNGKRAVGKTVTAFSPLQPGQLAVAASNGRHAIAGGNSECDTLIVGRDGSGNVGTGRRGQTIEEPRITECRRDESDADTSAGLRGSQNEQADIFIEIGSSAIARLEGERPFDMGSMQILSLARSNLEHGHIHCLLGKLWERGAKVDWVSYASRHRRRRVSAPTYPFERTRHWVDEQLRAKVRSDSKFDSPPLESSPSSRPEHGDEQERVKHLFQSLLAVADVGLDESFTDLGGDSLLATQLASRVRDIFGVVITLREILASPTISGVAKLIKAARPALPDGISIERVPRKPWLPLSFSQQRLWFLDSLDSGNPTFNISAAVRLNGPLDQGALEESVNAVVARHEALRTGFRLEEGRPVTYIEKEARGSLSRFDLQSLPSRRQQLILHELAQEESRKGFWLDSPPLLRATLFRLATRESILIFTIHHIVADGWSLGVLVREVAENYQRIRQGRPPLDSCLPIQYVDFAAWQAEMLQGETLERLLGYWRGKLGGELPLLELQTDHPRPPRLTYRGERQFVTIAGRTMQALQKISSRRGTTLYMLLLAAFAVLLHRYTRQTDLLIGSPVANRNRSELEDLIGCFVNVLVMRIDVSGNPSFEVLLERVKGTTLDAFANQDLPFERLVEELRPARDLSRTPIFQALLVLQNTPTPNIEVDDLSISPFDVDPETAIYDLTLSVQESASGLNGWLEFNADLFQPSTIRRMIGHFQTLLESIAANPERPVGELEILSDEERQWLLKDLNVTTLGPEAPRTLHDLMRQRVMQSPEAIAICHEDSAITYGELDRRANQLANYLRRLGAGPEVVIGLYMERSIQAIVGLLGILKAGAAYLPIDPGYPATRLELILKETRVSLVVSIRSLAATLPAGSARLLCLDADWQEIARESEEPPESGVVPENLAYVVYTSGSTGQPKGVMVPHTGLLNLIRAQGKEFNVTPDDRVLLYTSLGFDASLFEICMALGHGAQLVVTRQSDLLPTSAFIPMLRKLGITNMAIFPSALALLEDNDVMALRTLIVGGEACPRAVAERWQHKRQMFNTYGTSETTIWATSGACDNGETVSIGRALRNTSVYVLDAFMNPVPAGVAGEICVGGIGVARGYVGRSNLTAERFLPNPFSEKPGERMYRTGDLGRVTMSGKVEFLGRLDHQIKVQGVRIELAEVEAAMLKHPAVKQAVVKASGEGANKFLVGYFLSSELDGSDAENMREYLSRLLPVHMIPTLFIPLEKLPLLSNGKLDQRALPSPDAQRLRARTQHSPPDTDLKMRIAAVIEETLGVEHIGSNENLFTLGAHSLLMVRLKSRLDTVLGCELGVLDLFQNPTVNGIAEIIGGEPQRDSVVESSASRAQLRQQLREQRI
jgi:amino acid adenylation domain-containing protein